MVFHFHNLIKEEKKSICREAGNGQQCLLKNLGICDHKYPDLGITFERLTFWVGLVVSLKKICIIEK
jgi:hypothetical protein